MSETRGIAKTCKRTWVAVVDKNPQVTFSEEQLKGMFRRFDENGDGCLSKKELNHAFNNLGSSFPSWRAWRALRHADTNGDGHINEDEFQNLLKYALKCGYKIS